MSGDLSGFSLFELFKAEAELHSAALSQGLLALESNPDDTSQVEPLMRAAHSIKGAARIVDMDIVVELAHAMEDCFVAVQKGHQQLNTARVDQLLAGVDILHELSQITEQAVESWLTTQRERCQKLTESLRQPVTPPLDQKRSAEVRPATGIPRSTEDSPVSAPDALAERREPAADKTSTSVKPTIAENKSEPAAEQRTVPVSASTLNRIMRLASESMVEARQLQSMQHSLSALHDIQRKWSQALEQLHAGSSERSAQAIDTLRALNQQSHDLLHDHSRRLERTLWKAERTSTALYHEVIASRMRPFIEGTHAFPRMIRDLANALGKRASFTVIGGAVEVDRDILRKLEAPLNHLLRNCVDHGLETPEERRAAGKPEIGRITLEARHQAGTLAIEVRDDGRGIDAESLRRKIVDRKLLDASMAAELSNAELFEFLFLPGFSTASQVTEVSGRGVGLDVVRSMVQEVSGTVRVEAQVGQGAVFSLRLPVTLSVVRAALAEIAGELYAFPLSKLERIVRVSVEELEPVQGKLQFTLDGASVGLVRSEDVLDLSGATPIEDCLSVVVIRKDHYLCGVVVDRFIGEQDLVVRPLDPRLGKVPQISSAAITEEGDVLLIVDVEDLLHSVQQLLGEGRLRGMTSLVTHDRKARPRVLVVDDSITVREVERQLLVAEGYDVDVAIDGQDGWHALRSGSYDLLVSDIDMPRMSGLELIKAARQDSRFEHLPIIIVSYKDREEDRLRGFEVGANAYLTKGSFHDNSFVRTVSDLIGAID